MIYCELVFVGNQNFTPPPRVAYAVHLIEEIVVSLSRQFIKALQKLIALIIDVVNFPEEVLLWVEG